jgi:hypothetical protein
MKDRPILFSAPMVRAILAGTKTQTRRVVKARSDKNMGPRCVLQPHELAGEVNKGDYQNCPYGQPGDRLWVRESFSGPYCMERTDEYPAYPPSKWPKESDIWYWADGEPTHGDWTRPRPSIHMPRWANRITLGITGVRVERLQAISAADAIAEGVNIHPDHHGKPPTSIYSPVQAYRDLWGQINGDSAWDANPWVWVIEFERVAE